MKYSPGRPTAVSSSVRAGGIVSASRAPATSSAADTKGMTRTLKAPFTVQVPRTVEVETLDFDLPTSPPPAPPCDSPPLSDSPPCPPLDLCHQLSVAGEAPISTSSPRATADVASINNTYNQQNSVTSSYSSSSSYVSTVNSNVLTNPHNELAQQQQQQQQRDVLHIARSSVGTETLGAYTDEDINEVGPLPFSLMEEQLLASHTSFG